MNAFRSNLAQLCIFGITAVLISAFVVQFGMKELPCPLCILQRMGMILAALGPAWLLMRAMRGPVNARDYAQCYGVSVLAEDFERSARDVLALLCDYVVSRTG